VKVVPVPVTLALAVELVMLPVRGEVGHAVELQSPLALDTIVAAKATEVAAINRRVRVRNFEACKAIFIV
jgi:hypothetical protein